MNAVAPDVPGPFKQDDGSPVPFSEAKFEWARAGYDVLVGVARNPQGHITYEAIADEIQDATGIRARVLLPQWIGKPLALVAEMCVRNGEPQLTALVVSADSLEVGAGYAETYSIAGQPLPRNLQRAAAEMRVTCYDYFSRREAVGWDKTKLTHLTAKVRPPAARSTRRAAVVPTPPKVCGRCRLELLPSGCCGYCD